MWGARHAPGAVAQALSSYRHWPMTKAFLTMSEDEFVDMLRAEGVGEHMVEIEAAAFRELKQRREPPPASRRARRADVSLDPYVEAEVRRLAGVAADEVLADLRESS